MMTSSCLCRNWEGAGFPFQVEASYCELVCATNEREHQQRDSKMNKFRHG